MSVILPQHYADSRQLSTERVYRTKTARKSYAPAKKQPGWNYDRRRNWHCCVAHASGARSLGANQRHCAGRAPIAHIALAYGQGARPISVIIDVCGQNGEGGSATLAGERQYAEIPLHGAVDGRYHLIVTATYRILGRSHTVAQAFDRQSAFDTDVGR